MRHAPNPALPISGHCRAPLGERVAGWSAAHRKTAVFGWLLLVIAAATVGQMLGINNAQSYDPGQSGRAERILSLPDVQTPPSQSVLIQPRAAGAAGDPQIRQTAAQVSAALHSPHGSARDIRSPLDPRGRSLVSADGRSALVTFTVTGNAAQTVTAALRAVAAVPARHPDLTVAEVGDTSVNQAINASVSRDLRRAEVTSVPITLIC